MIVLLNLLFFFSSRRRHTRCALVTGVQTCALPICRLGEDVFSPAVTLRQAPHLQRASGSAHHDSEGVATQARTLVDHGRLESWLLSSYSARKLGLQTTGNAGRSEEHTSELQSLMRISYAVFCLKKKKINRI